MREIQNPNSSVIYTEKIITCDSCGEQYVSGLLTEIRDVGLYCHLCFKSALVEYFEKHPSSDYALIRMVYSLYDVRNSKNE
jgi:hypothetical protein